MYNNELVTVITPTTNDRAEFNSRIADIIANQDYPHIEHLFDHSANTIGYKRNSLCERAKGSIILHADSDDWYAKDWVSKSVEALQGYDITGLKKAYFLNTNDYNGRLYEYKLRQGYCLGATMCYWRKTWERNKFNENVQYGEDSLFLANVGHVHNHDYIDGFTAMVHQSNTISHKAFTSMMAVNIKEIPYVKYKSSI